MLDGHAPFTGHRDAVIGNGRQFPLEVGRGDRKRDAGCCSYAREVDGADAGMRYWTSDKSHVQHARQNEIIDISAVPAQEALVLAAGEGLADEAFLALRHERILPPDVAEKSATESTYVSIEMGGKSCQ